MKGTQLPKRNVGTPEVRLVLFFVRAPLTRELGAARADEVLAAFDAEIPLALAQVPEMSPGLTEGKQFLVGTAYMLAFYRAMWRFSYPVAEIGRVMEVCYREAMQKVPGPARALYRWWFFRPAVHRKMVARMLGLGPHDFHGRFVEGDGGFTFGVDYTRCALQQFLLSVGAGELAPYICPLDEIQSEVFGLGLRRTGTIARGASHCDFRWKQGR